jgi:hypothetical protein|tara:strand:+ start:415 stop:582 length:168 start_codon:yes stop_codon:yes gene_type:complete
MNKTKFKKKELIRWFFWLWLIIIWNYGYPEASPLEDVIVAVILSLIFIVLKYYNK